MAAGTGQPELDKQNTAQAKDHCQDRTARTGQPGQDCQDRTARAELSSYIGPPRTGLPAQDCLDKTAMAGQKRKDSQKRTTRTLQLEHRTARMEQSETEVAARTGQPKQDMQNRTYRQSRTASTGLSGQVC